MSIEYRQGDVITAFIDKKINVLAHCCNRQNTFGSGIAKSIRERLPYAYDADTEWYKYGDKLRNMSFAFIEDSLAYNLYGQEYYGFGKQMDYGRLSQALYEMVKHLKAFQSETAIIGMPYNMASARAGGNWDIVLELIEWYLRNYKVVIYKL